MHIAHCVSATQLSVRLKHLDTVLQREVTGLMREIKYVFCVTKGLTNMWSFTF